MARVPTTATVVRGASVNIVLKADQPTGRTVAGTVQEVLTRGNHPRGIKVRLVDGRVGRVQSHAGPNHAGEVSADQNVSDAAGRPPDAFGERRPPRRRHARGQEQEADLPSSQVGLEAYMRPAKQRKGGRDRIASRAGGGAEEPKPNTPSDAVTCPVCGVFEGDASAVEHHIASHFD